MRVIAGYLGGRNFSSPKGLKTHPLSDKARGGLFNVLGDINRLTVLDAFSGSGALAIEAISRGATSATAIESDKAAHRIITQNAESLGITARLKAIRALVGAWSDRNLDLHFDLVLADPPYDNIPYKEVEKLIKHLSTNGTMVLSWPANKTELKLSGLTQVQVKNYGDAKLVFYQKIS